MTKARITATVITYGEAPETKLTVQTFTELAPGIEVADRTFELTLPGALRGASQQADAAEAKLAEIGLHIDVVPR